MNERVRENMCDGKGYGKSHTMTEWIFNTFLPRKFLKLHLIVLVLGAELIGELLDVHGIVAAAATQRQWAQSLHEGDHDEQVGVAADGGVCACRGAVPDVGSDLLEL